MTVAVMVIGGGLLVLGARLSDGDDVPPDTITICCCSETSKRLADVSFLPQGDGRGRTVDDAGTEVGRRCCVRDGECLRA